MSADWTGDSARAFQLLYNAHFSLKSDNSLFTADFSEPGYKDDGTYDFMDKTTIRSRMRNGLLEISDRDGKRTSDIPSSRYSHPLLTNEQRLLLGAAQRVAVEPETTVPVLESIFPFMMDYTTKESERLFAKINNTGTPEDDEPEEDEARERSTRSRMTLGNEHATRSLDAVRNELESAREAGMNLFKREVAFRGGTSFVRIFRGRRFFEVGTPSVLIRYEMIPKSDSKGVTSTDRQMLRGVSDLTFHQTRFLDVRLAILITSMVEEARLVYNSFFSPPLRVSRICKMQGEPFGVIVNDAWAGNLGSWIRSFNVSEWKRAMAEVKEYLVEDFVDGKLRYLNQTLFIQHGDLKIDNVVYINIGTGDEDGRVVPHFGFIDFGVSSLYKRSSSKDDGPALYERVYRSSLFAANTGTYLDRYLDVSYLQYSLRYAFLAHFGIPEQENEFFNTFKSWFPLIGDTPRELKIYKWRQEKYAGTEDGKAWVHETDSITGHQMSMLDINDTNNSIYPRAELFMTVAEIARRRLGLSTSGTTDASVDGEDDEEDDDEGDSEDDEDNTALAKVLRKEGGSKLTLLGEISKIYKEMEDRDLDNYRF